MDKRSLAFSGLCLGLLLAPVQAATQLQIDTARSKAAAWLILQQKGDGNWRSGRGADISVTAQVTAGLLAAGVKGYPLSSAGAWLGNADAQSVDALARQIRGVAASAPFANLIPQHDKLLSWRADPDRSLWGSYAKYGTSFSDTALAILATLSFSYAGQEAQLKTAVYCDILPKQFAAGGWPYIPTVTTVSATAPATAATGAVLPTALTLLALRAVQVKYAWDSESVSGCGPSASLTTALQTGGNWLLTQKNGDGGIGESGVSSVFATALGYQGVRTVVGADDARLVSMLDYLLGRQATNGSWADEPMLTGLVLEQLAARATPSPDTDGDGIPDAVELALGSNPAVADSRSLADKGGGNGAPGVNVPVVLSVSARVNQPFSHTLVAPLAVAPLTWRVVGGALPPGLGLTASGANAGLISGTPSQLGSYVVQYASTDSGTPAITRPLLGVMNVVREPPGNGDITGDGKVDLADLIVAQRIALGKIVPTAAQLAAGDVAPESEPDGVIDAADVIWLTRRILQLR